MEMNMDAVFCVAGALTFIGLLGILLRKNLVIVIMSLEVMLLGGALALMGAARVQRVAAGVADGALMIPFVLIVAAAEVCIGLTLVMKIFKTQNTIWVDEIDAEES